MPQLAILTVAIVLIAVAGVLGRLLWSALMVLAGLGLIGLMLHLDSRASTRLLPRGAGDLRAIAGSGFAMMFSLCACAIGFSVYGPALLQAMDGISPLVAGYVIGTESVGWVICAFLVAGLRPGGQSNAIRAGPVVVLIGLSSVALTMPGGSPILVGCGGLVLGAGFGLCWALASRRVLASLAEDEAALGASALPTTQLAGSAAGAAVAGVLANLLGLSHGITATLAHSAGFWLFAAFVPVAGFACFAGFRLAGSDLGGYAAGAIGRIQN